MRIFGVLAASILLVLLSGCASAQSPEQAAKNELLEYTDKASVVGKNGGILVVGSYLNPVRYPQKKDKEVFGLAVSPSNVVLSDVRLKGAEDIVVERASDKLAKELGFYLPWASYYLVTAPAIKAKNLEIYADVDNVSVQLNFVKVPRSLYWNR